MSEELPRNYGLAHEPVTPDSTVVASRSEGPASHGEIPPPEKVDSWSEVDPEFDDFLDIPEDMDFEDADELTEEELAAEGLAADPVTAPEWVEYELHGRDLDEEPEWRLMSRGAVEDDFEAEIGNLKTDSRMEFRVRFISNMGRHSKWSTPIQLTLPSDFTPPPEPTAPLLSEKSGFVTFGWDGLLMGQTPVDFSHVNAYVRQMHPQGVPEGEAGDSQLIGTFSRQASDTTGSLVDRVPHEFWLTSVDTTGNESYRSEIVTITPTQPVDVQRIRDEVAEAEERVGENLDQRLTAGLTSIYAELDEREEDVIERAKREAAEDAQTHYDSLAAAASAAQDKADQVAAEQGETSQAAQDARDEAEAALAAAQAAAQDAQDAHSQAGAAERLAQQAMDAANNSSRIHSSTSAPSGTANEGDMWYRWSSTGADRTLDGIWTYEDGNWQSMGTLDPQMIPVLDVGQQTVGQLNFDRISGFAAQVQHLAIGNAENLFPEYWHGEEALGEYVYHTTHNLDATARGRFFSENPPVPSLWSAHVLNNRRGWQIAGAGGSQSIAFRMGPGRGIRVTPGERYAIQSLVRDFGGSSFLGWVIHFISLDGSQGTSGLDRIDLDISGRVHGASDTNGDTDTFQVPDLGWGPMDMIITLRHTGSSFSGSGQRTVMEPKLRKMMDGSVVVDGSLGAAKIDVEDLAANTARMETLWAGFGGFLEASVDRLFINEGEFRRIEGAQVVGSEIMTSSDWASNGGAAVRQNGTHGNIVTADLDGNITARLGGGRNELDGVSVTGSFRTSNSSGRVEIDESSVTRYDVWSNSTTTETMPHISIRHSDDSGAAGLIAADSDGNLIVQPQAGVASGSAGTHFTGTVNSARFLSNNYQLRTQNDTQPGGLILSGPRTVLMGRPTQEGWPTQMFIQGSTSARNMTSGSTLWSVTYSSPAPQGSRFVQATAETELTNNSNHRVAAVTVSNRRSAGFDVAATPVNGGTIYYRVSWLASWE